MSKKHFQIISSILAAATLLVTSTQAGFLQDLEGTYADKNGFRVQVDLTKGKLPRSNSSRDYDIDFPDIDEGLMTWGYRVIDVFQNQAIQKTALEMGMSVGKWREEGSLKAFLNTSQKISIAGLQNLQQEANQAYLRNLDLAELNMEFQIRNLATETLANGIYDDGTDYDIVYEIMKIEAEWAGDDLVSKQRLHIYPEIDDIEKCSGFACFFLRFENEDNPEYEENKDAILAHLQHIAEAFYQAAKEPKLAVKRPIGLFALPGIATTLNLFKEQSWAPVQIEMVPINRSRPWYDYAGSLGGFWNTGENWWALDEINREGANNRHAKMKIIAQANCQKQYNKDPSPSPTDKAKYIDKCTNNLLKTTTRGLLYSIDSLQEWISTGISWTGDKAEDIVQLFSGSALDTLDICQEKNMMNHLINLNTAYNNNIPIAEVQKKADEFCQIMTADSAAINAADNNLPNLATDTIQTGQFQGEINNTVTNIQRIVLLMENIKNQLKELREKYNNDRANCETS